MFSFLGYTVPFIPSFVGMGVAVLVMILLYRCVRTQNRVGILFGRFYDEMYIYFSEILGEEEFAWIKTYVTNMFFVIFIYNILGLITDFISPIFGYNTLTQTFHLAQYVGYATSDYHFNIAMAAIGILIMLGIQLRSMSGRVLFGKIGSSKQRTIPFFKAGNFFYEYLPVRGKNILSIERGTMHPLLHYPLWLLIKIFDIIISVFIGFLDIIGVLAKIISLSFRLFGNMQAGTALLAVLVVGMGSSTMEAWGFSFPIIAPLVLLLQGLLVASIQAFVFPLLIAIFIKVARMSSEEETTQVA